MRDLGMRRGIRVALPAAMMAAAAVAALAVTDVYVPCGGGLLGPFPRGWNFAVTPAPIPFGVDPTSVVTEGYVTSDEIADAMLRGVSAWNAARWDLVAPAVDLGCRKGFHGDGKNCVTFDDKSVSSSALATTAVGWYRPKSHTCDTPDLGTLLLYDYRDTDTVLNSDYLWTVPDPPGTDTCRAGCVAAYDVNGTVAHEAGHALGVAHSLNREDTMWAGLNACDCSDQSLTACDLQAASNLCY